MASTQASLNKIVSKTPKVCIAETKLSDAAVMMAKENCGFLPVVSSLESMVPIGAITDRDIVCRTIARGLNPINLQVKDCMTKGCQTILFSATLPEALKVMNSKKVGRLVLVDRNGMCCGVISKADATERAPKKLASVAKKSKRMIPHKIITKSKSGSRARPHA